MSFRFIKAMSSYALQKQKPTRKQKKNLQTPVKLDTELTLAQYDPWVIKKTLQVKDTNSVIRLPAKETRDEIIGRWSNKLVIGDSVTVKLYDWDTKKTYDVSIHQDSRGYFLNLGWFLILIDRHLKEGDTVGFYWDNIDSTLNFKVLQKKIA